MANAKEKNVTKTTFTDQIMRREFSMLFDSFEAYDVQAVRKESREEGKLEGKLETYIENILSLLEDFGPMPDELYCLLKKETNLETLKLWIKYAAKADSIEDFRKKQIFKEPQNEAGFPASFLCPHLHPC